MLGYHCYDCEKIIMLTDESVDVCPSCGGVEETYVVQRWENPETGSWTITVTFLDGLTCMLADGTGWQEIGPEPPLPPVQHQNYREAAL